MDGARVEGSDREVRVAVDKVGSSSIIGVKDSAVIAANQPLGANPSQGVKVRVEIALDVGPGAEGHTAAAISVEFRQLHLTKIQNARIEWIHSYFVTVPQEHRLGRSGNLAPDRGCIKRVDRAPN